MRSVFLVGMAFLTFVSVPKSTTAQELKHEADATYQMRSPDIVISSNKNNYREAENVILQVMLKNTSNRHFYVFGTLEWGYSATLLLIVRDSSGKQIQPVGAPDDRIYTSPNDKSAFVKLSPHHFVGATFVFPIKFLNLTKPGRYAIYTEYSAPFSCGEVELEPFFCKEKGKVKSNVLWIKVIR